MQKIIVGSNKKTSVLKGVDFNRDSHKGCVIHIIYIGGEDHPKLEEVNEYITDQIPDLWNDLRAGDLIEDATHSGYRSEGVFCVDFDEEQSKAERIIKNGLKIVELNTEYDDYGAIPLNFYAITRFPLGYHDYDNFVVNNRFASDIDGPRSYWHSDPYYAPLDKKKLKLDSLTSDNVFKTVFGFKKQSYIEKNKDMFYYIVIRYKKKNYLFGRYAEDEYDFLSSFDETIFLIYHGKKAINIVDRWSYWNNNNDNYSKDRQLYQEVYDLLKSEDVDVSCFLYL